MVQMIKAYLKGDQRDWDLYLGCLTGAYRATVQESTGMTPNLLMLGREVRLPLDVIYSRPESMDHDTIESYGDYVDKLRSQMNHAHEVARRHLQKALRRHKDSYDVKTKLHIYEPGDFVWFHNILRKEGICPKLQPAYEGPYVITKKINNLDYEIQKDKDGQKKSIVHHNRLKPYLGQNPPAWAKKLKVVSKK